jgi:hypothetical protein
VELLYVATSIVLYSIVYIFFGGCNGTDYYCHSLRGMYELSEGLSVELLGLMAFLYSNVVYPFSSVLLQTIGVEFVVE